MGIFIFQPFTSGIDAKAVCERLGGIPQRISDLAFHLRSGPRCDITHGAVEGVPSNLVSELFRDPVCAWVQSDMPLKQC
jgi:hypothetical protein